MKIAVLGGGHGAFAAAADLAEQGHEVALWRRDAAAFAPVLASQSIVLKDFRGRRVVRLARASTDIGDVVRDVELVIVPTPALAQIDIARAMAPHLSDGLVVFLPPGTFGSYAMMRAIRDSGARARVTFAETGTLPYLARKHAADEVAITIRAKRLPTGCFPATDSTRALAIIRQAYPSVEPIEDALSGALMNAGPIIHPPLILMNAGPLDLFSAVAAGRDLLTKVPGNVLALGKWDIHNEGTQPAIRRVTDALDAERIAIREALGYRPDHFPLRDHYTSDRWMYGDAHDRLTDSGDWRETIDLTRHRYMREDVEYGLAFLASLAQWADVDAPVTRGLLALGAAVCGTDFTRGGPRTLASLGLAGLSRTEMKTLLERGL